MLFKNRTAWEVSETERKYKQRKNKKFGAGPGTANSTRRNKTFHIDDAIKDFIQEAGYEKKLTDVHLFLHWEEIVGHAIARVTIPEKLERGRLTVKVLDDSWRHQLHYMRQELMDKINLATRENTVREVMLTR